MKWVVFALVSILWIGVCWFFGSMVSMTEGAPRGSIAQQECAQRLLRQSGGTGDYQAFYNSPECREAGRAAARAAGAPARNKGLLIGFLPVLLLGAWLAFGGRGR